MAFLCDGIMIDYIILFGEAITFTSFGTLKISSVTNVIKMEILITLYEVTVAKFILK